VILIFFSLVKKLESDRKSVTPKDDIQGSIRIDYEKVSDLIFGLEDGRYKSVPENRRSRTEPRVWIYLNEPVRIYFDLNCDETCGKRLKPSYSAINEGAKVRFRAFCSRGVEQLDVTAKRHGVPRTAVSSRPGEFGEFSAATAGDAEVTASHNNLTSEPIKISVASGEPKVAWVTLFLDKTRIDIIER